MASSLPSRSTADTAEISIGEPQSPARLALSEPPLKHTPLVGVHAAEADSGLHHMQSDARSVAAYSALTQHPPAALTQPATSEPRQQAGTQADDRATAEKRRHEGEAELEADEQAHPLKQARSEEQAVGPRAGGDQPSQDMEAGAAGQSRGAQVTAGVAKDDTDWPAEGRADSGGHTEPGGGPQILETSPPALVQRVAVHCKFRQKQVWAGRAIMQVLVNHVCYELDSALLLCCIVEYTAVRSSCGPDESFWG